MPIFIIPTVLVLMPLLVVRIPRGIVNTLYDHTSLEVTGLSILSIQLAAIDVRPRFEIRFYSVKLSV